MPWDVSFNTAVSFVTNTSWQFYAGETSLSIFSQIAVIALQSLLSMAVGLAVGIAVILTGVIVVIVVLNFLPALAIGPGRRARYVTRAVSSYVL
jgi:K+-transporting ATPase A subunit